MDLTVEEFVDGLFTVEAAERPSDSVKPEDLSFELPERFDEKKFNRGRQFYYSHCAVLSSSMLVGLVAVLAVPSILKVLINTYRSTTVYTAYKRYGSTFLHTQSWFKHDLKPGTISWKSLKTVRTRHLRAGLAGKAKGYGVVSQRDLALTQFGFIGYSILCPDKYGIYQLRSGDWEAYNYCWRVFGHMIGIEDRYNICRNTVEVTREVCQILLDRVFTPCLDNVPEYYEHMSRVLLEGLSSVVESNTEFVLFFCKYLSKVPGYIYTEQERIDLQKKLTEQLKRKSIDTGVDSSSLIQECAVDGLPSRKPHLLYLRDYDTVTGSPPYSQLSWISKFKLNFNLFLLKFYPTYVGRYLVNLHFKFNVIVMEYCPFWAYLKFGFRNGFITPFSEDPVDNTKPKLNSEYLKAT